MATLNKVFLIGRLGRDPEMKVTPSGTSVCSFSLAVAKEVTVSDGVKREDTTWVDMEAWAKTAELVGKYLTKGSTVFVEGRLKLEQWEDKTTGQKRSRMKVVAENVQFLDGKKAEGQGQGEPQREYKPLGNFYPGGKDESPRGAAARGDPIEERKNEAARGEEDVPF